MPQKPERMEQREKTNELNYFVNPRYKGKNNPFMTEDGCYVWNTELLVDEYFIINDSFVHLQKLYYRNGQLKEKSVYSLFSKVSTEVYDEEGYLINRTLFESPVKDKLIDGMDYETFFEKEGWYNRATGESAFCRSPLNKGELSDEVFRCIDFRIKDSSEVIVNIWRIRKIPQRFFDKSGKSREDGSKYLETKIHYPHSKSEKDAIIEPDSRVGGFEVTYCIDVKSGTYKVDWKIVLKIE